MNAFVQMLHTFLALEKAIREGWLGRAGGYSLPL
jgi:hypothetical protein